MNRRRLITSGLALTVAEFRSAAPVAQGAAATPDHLFHFDFANRRVTAARNFTSATLRLSGAMKYGFVVDVYADADAARAAYRRLRDYFGGYLANLPNATGRTVVLGERTEVAAPALGDKCSAELARARFNSIVVYLLMVFTQKDDLLHRWLAQGVVDPTDELFCIAEAHLTFKAVDVECNADVFSLLPDLADLPAGFALPEGGEIIVRYDED